MCTISTCLEMDYVLFIVGDLRLVNSTSTNALSGRLEIFLQGQWGTVCDDFFGLDEANVACKQLGYPSANGVGNVRGLK